MDPEADVFEVIKHRTREFLERGRVKPGYLEIAMLMEMDNSEFIKKIRKSSAERYVKMLERDKERGLFKPEADSELVINLISTFNLNEYFRNGLDKERYLKNLGDAIKIIKEGIALFKEVLFPNYPVNATGQIKKRNVDISRYSTFIHNFSLSSRCIYKE